MPPENDPEKERKPGGYGGCWPTREQELLLKASLLKGNAAVDAFQEWKSLVDIKSVDPGSYRLFPLLYVNLKSSGVEDPLINIFEWVYRTTQKNTAVLFENMLPLLRQFRNAGVEFMLLKGTALILTYYKDRGLRPMMDVDILVRTTEAREAIKLLTSLGWRSSITPLKGFSEIGLLSRLGWTPKERGIEDFSDEFFLVRHGQDFVDLERFTIDLHWHVLHGYNEADADSPFWDDARTVEFDGIGVSVLNPTDQLLHVCSHGVSWNFIPPIRWIADAVTIVNSVKEEIEWGRLTAASKRHGKVLRMREALSFLKSTLQVPVPDTALNELDSFIVSRTEISEYEIRIQPPGILDGLVELSFLYNSYSRHNADKGAFAKFVGFPKFLQHVFGMDNAWHLVLYSFFELVRRGSKIPGKLLGKLRAG